MGMIVVSSESRVAGFRQATGEYTHAEALPQREAVPPGYFAAKTRLASDSSIVVEASAGRVSMSC